MAKYNTKKHFEAKKLAELKLEAPSFDVDSKGMNKAQLVDAMFASKKNVVPEGVEVPTSKTKEEKPVFHRAPKAHKHSNSH